MHTFLSRRRGDLTLGIAAVSLFASLGGPSWAAGLIDGHQLKTRSVRGKALAPRAVSNSRIFPNAVTGAKIRNGSVAGADIADGSIARADVVPDFFAGLQPALAPGSLVTDLFADRAVTGRKLAVGAVSNTRLLNDAVTSAKVADGSITGADLADGTVATADLADGGVTIGKLADGSVTGAKVADGTVGAAKLQRNAVTGAALDASGTATLNFDAIAAGACASRPVDVTGADVSDDAVAVTPGPGFAGTLATAAVQGPEQFTVTVCNLGAAPVDPDGADGAAYRWVAVQA